MVISIDVSPEGGYLLQAGGQAQTVPTFVDLMRVMLTEFKIGASGASTKNTGNGTTHMLALEELVEDLNEYNLKPHQIVSILGKLQRTITMNLPADVLKPRSKQIQLMDMGFVIEGAIPKFEEAPPFVLLNIRPERLGGLYEYDYNGRIAVSVKGRRNEPLFLKKSLIPQLKSLTRKSLEKVALQLGDKGMLLVDYIEILKDRDMGIYPILHVNTHIPQDCGEIDAEVLEAAGGTAGEEDDFNGAEE